MQFEFLYIFLSLFLFIFYCRLIHAHSREEVFVSLFVCVQTCVCIAFMNRHIYRNHKCRSIKGKRMKERRRGRNGDRREAYGSPCSPAGTIGLSRGPRGHVTSRAEGFLRLRLIRTLFPRGLVPRGVQLQPLRECEAKSWKEMYT